MKKTITLLLLLCVTACGQQPEQSGSDAQLEPPLETSISKIQYPQTRKSDTVDEYFGEKVADPYRWLEDDLSPETAEWVRSQNKLTFSYLENISYRDQIKKILEEKWNYERVSAPFKEGDYWYFYKNDGLQNQSVIYRYKDGAPEKVEVFLNPNQFSQDGTTSLTDIQFSKDGSLAAYAISEGGSDWRKIIVIDAISKTQLEPPLVDVKFSSIAWVGNQGFYYSSYDKPKGSELSAKTDQHKLYYHELGQPQSSDHLVFGGTADQKRRYVGGYVSDDDRFLFISAANSTSGNELYLKDLSNPDSPLVTVINNFDSDTYVIDNLGTKLYLVTNLDAPNKRIVTADAGDPKPQNWQDFIAETEHVLNPSKGAGYFFARYMVDAISKVKQYDYDGKLIREIELPGPGTASGFAAKKEASNVYYSFTNYKTPRTIYQLDPDTGKSRIYAAPKVSFNPDNYVSRQVFYTSKDGTRVPMIITHRKDLALNGKNPTILYGYGGFNISLTPRFSVANAVWMELGGVYAVPNIRGGGEYGKQWHRAGTKRQKQNVFDDFIAAAEYLIKEGYTDSDHLAIRGGSNGGLLVGAVMTQRPELFKVALPAVGVMDMLRYHKFTAGAGWAYDYGTADDSREMFEYLKSYSPLHNIRKGVHYPATLITTADHDDRVVPAHSFKFAAELQAKQAGNAPTLIRIETKAGHGAGTPVSKRIEQYADLYAFTLYNMGVESIPEVR